MSKQVLSRVCSTAQGSEAVMALLSTADGVSRVHASRRFFDILQEHDIDIPVIHQRVFTAGGKLAGLAQITDSPLHMMPNGFCVGNLSSESSLKIPVACVPPPLNAWYAHVGQCSVSTDRGAVQELHGMSRY